jgi:hypothetical protein
MRATIAVLSFGVACDTPVRAKNDGGATAPAASTATTATAAAATASAGKLPLTSGASLAIPATARSEEAPSVLPDQALRAHMFTLGEDARLMINELKRPDGGCGKALDEEWGKMQKAQDDTDQQRLKFRRMQNIEQLEIAGNRVLFSASSHSPGGDQKAALATLMLCTARDYVVIMYAVKKSEIGSEVKPMMIGIANSYSAKR